MLRDALGNFKEKSERMIKETKLQKSKDEHQEDDKLGTIVELELEKEMQLDSLNTKTKKFEDLVQVCLHLIEGKNLSESSIEGTNLDVERIFDSNLSKNELKILHKAIMIKYAESEINQMKMLQSEKNQEVEFETFQPQENQQENNQNNVIDETTRTQFLQDIEEIEEKNRNLEKKNRVLKTKMENLMKEVEKMQQEAIDDGFEGEIEGEDEEDIEIGELEKRIFELEMKKGELMKVA